MSKRQQRKFDKVYQDFTKKHLLYEPQTKPTEGFAKSPPSLPIHDERGKEGIGRKPGYTRHLVVSKALERVRPQATDFSEQTDFSQTAPVRLKPSDPTESYILRSTMTPQWLYKDSEDRQVSPARQTSPALKELERNRVLETRLKELSEKFSTLQRSYKELLTRTGVDHYKAKYEELEDRHRREKEALESRVRDLEVELEEARHMESAITPAEGTPIPTSEELLFSQIEARADSETQLRELRERVERAESRLLVLEQARALLSS